MANTATRHDPSMLQSSISAGTVVVASTGAGAFQQIMLDGRHVLHADEPAAAGGGDTGPGPYELLPMALGSCRKSAAYRPLPPTEIDATSRRSRCHGATLAQYLAGSAGGPQGRGPVDASKANLV